MGKSGCKWGIKGYNGGVLVGRGWWKGGGMKWGRNEVDGGVGEGEGWGSGKWKRSGSVGIWGF